MVLSLQCLTLLLILEQEVNGSGGDVAHDFQQRGVALQIHIRLDASVDTQRPDHAVAIEEWHADERHRFVPATGSGAVEKARIAMDVGNDFGLAGLCHVPGYALAQPVTPQLPRRLVQAVRSFNGERALVQEGNRPPEHPPLTLQNRQRLT